MGAFRQRYQQFKHDIGWKAGLQTLGFVATGGVISVALGDGLLHISSKFDKEHNDVSPPSRKVHKNPVKRRWS